jgi:hypothetical protein
VTTGLVALGSVASFGSASNAGAPLALLIAPGTPGGTRVDYVASVRYEGFTQDFPGSFTVGQPRLFLADDLEVDVGWTIGAPGDAAVTGEWEYGDPVGTDSGGTPANPESDATPGSGVRCFTTGNGSTSVGGDDVDEGPTTLLSPLLDLSGVASAELSYRRWFANLTTLDDALTVSLSDDGGTSWTTLETVTGNQNSWTPVSFAVEDFVALTDEVRLRFRTGDVPNNSILEAAVDELALSIFDPTPRLNFYGRGAIGSRLAMHVTGQPGQVYAVRAGPTPASIPAPYGTILIQPSSSFVLVQGVIPANSLARTLATVPNNPGLVGQTYYAQALTLGPLALSNRAQVTFVP